MRKARRAWIGITAALCCAAFAGAVIAGNAVIVGNAGTSPSRGGSSQAHAAAHTGSQRTNAYGWRYVSLTPVFGRDVAIAGLAVNRDQLQITVRHDWVRANQATFSTSYHTAVWSRGRDVLSGVAKAFGIAKASGAPKGYAGPVRFVWPSALPRHYTVQTVKIMRGSKEIARWPQAVPLYGSMSTPQSAAPGSLDNQILGQTGDWLWVALKGPQFPPDYPRQIPYLSYFRYWDRLAAVNIATGKYRVYPIPRTTSLYESEHNLSGPGFAAGNHTVYVSVGSWIGVFPANPSSVARVSVLTPPPRATVDRRANAALADLRQRMWQEVNSLAVYWNSIAGRRKPGVTYGEHWASWNEDPVIFNHGLLPTDMIWGMEFPLPAGSAAARTRAALVQTIMQLLTSRLNGAAWSPAILSIEQARKLLGDKPPLQLPGYKIQGGVYLPQNPSVLNRGAPPLPGSFASYQTALATAGQIVAQRSPIGAFLPAPSSSLNPPKGKWLDIQYQVAGGAAPDGYLFTVSVGGRLPANSPSIESGSATTLFSAAGVPADQPLPAALRWSVQPIPGARVSRVALGHGIVGAYQTGRVNGIREQALIWQQDGIKWSMAPTSWNVNPVADARRIASSLVGKTFPSGGTGVFGYGSDSPSLVVIHTYSGRYALYAPGWGAAELAATMAPPTYTPQ